MSDDPAIAHQSLNIAIGKAAHPQHIEPGKRRSILLSTAQYRDPRQPRLGALENQKFKHQSIAVTGRLPKSKTPANTDSQPDLPPKYRKFSDILLVNLALLIDLRASKGITRRLFGKKL